MNNNIKLAIIDIDGMFYMSSKDTIEGSIQTFKDKFNNLLEKTQCTHYVGFYSNGRYFRNIIDPEYKVSRGKYAPPKWLKALKNWAIIEYGFQYMDNVEADDLCAYWINQTIYFGPGSRETYPYDRLSTNTFHFRNSAIDKDKNTVGEKVFKILCTPDKDLLESISGKHFNYSYKITDEAKAAKKLDENYEIKDEEVIKGWWVATAVNPAAFFPWEQMIIGDSVDGISGLYKKGKVYVEKLYGDGKSLREFQLIVFDEYMKEYGEAKGIFEFQKNYRLLHLLENDEDFMREVGKLPEFPIITKVKKESNNIEF